MTKDKKKLLYIIIGGLLVVALIFVFLLLLQAKTNQGNQSQLPSQTQPTKATRETFKNTNPLIDNSEVEQIEADYNKKLKEAGKPTRSPANYQFEYQLAPELKDNQKPQSFLIKNAYGVELCNLPSAPTMLTVYALKNHIKKEEASAVAKSFGIDSEPSATDYEANTFKYYFSNPVTNGYLYMYESSGTYMYHQVLVGIGADIGSREARNRAETVFLKYASKSGSTKFFPPSVEINADSDRDTYIFTYKGDWQNLKMIDVESIKALGTSQSVCKVKGTDDMNYVKIHIAKDGRLARFINKERTIVGSYTLPRASLEVALKDFGANPPIPPIVLPEGTDIKSGKVVIDQAVLVYFDYGELFPQVHYVPMYLTSGNVTSGTTTARVFTLIPAISKKDLEDSGVYLKVIQGYASTLQYGTFKMKPPKPPRPKPVGGCPGGLVDYVVSCKTAGKTVCGQFFSVPATIDDKGICDEGCKGQHLGVITYSAGEDPCAKAIEKYDEDLLQHYRKKPQPTGGDAECVLNGCPC